MNKIFRSFLVMSALLLFITSSYANNELTGIQLQSSRDHSASLQFSFAKAVKSKPLSFVMNQPERIIIDFPSTHNNLKHEQKAFNTSLIRKVQFLSGHNKLRAIVYLNHAASYTLTPRGSTLNLRLNRNFDTNLQLPNQRNNVLNSVEFTRGKETDSGKLILHLSHNSVQTKMQSLSDKFVLNLQHTRLGKKMAHQYDVSDYQTPAKLITFTKEGSNTRLSITMNKKYEVAAFQVGKEYVIEIVPRTSLNEKAASKVHERISLNFQNIPVRQVLQILAEFTGKNMIISNNVSGNITLRLQQVPWQDALDLILNTQGLVKRESNNIIMIAPAGELAAQDKKQLQAQEELSALGPLESETFPIKYGKAEVYYDTLKNPDNTLLSSRGKIILNKRTNMLFIEDTQEKLQGIKGYINKTDIPVKQVEIEARIVTIDKSFERQLGIKWNVEGRTATGNGATAPNSFNLDLGAQGIGGTAPATLAMGTLSGDTLIGLELSALEAEGGGEILSSPRLLTADQQEAVIRQGTEIPYSETTSSGAAAIAFKPAVLQLKVTPQITPNNKVLLRLEVNQDAKSKDTAEGQPIIDTRHISTNVLVDNGETVVLGGIYERTKSNNVTRVPFISAIPIIGELFKHRSIKDDKKELLIFVTPRIVHNDLKSR